MQAGELCLGSGYWQAQWGLSVHEVTQLSQICRHLVPRLLQIQGLPTMVFVGTDPNKPALRTEGLLPAHIIKEIVQNELIGPQTEAAAGA